MKDKMIKGDFKSLARCISLVENDVPGADHFYNRFQLPVPRYWVLPARPGRARVRLPMH